jgi:pimeloyl-ACP methyl ester carboxylesterase
LAKLESDGATLEYLDEGRGDPPFVFVHGWGTDHTIWRLQAGALKGSHRCVSIDLRGCGGSSLTPPYDMVTAADDVARVMRELKVSEAIVVGHDTGALIALMLNDRHPDLTCGIVMAEPPLNAAGGGSLEQLSRKISASQSLDCARTLIESSFIETTPHDTREQVRRAILGCPPDVAAGMLVAGIPLSDQLGDLIRGADRRPFMVMWGMKPPGRPEHLRDITMFLRQEPILDAGHFLQLEQPELTTALLRAFVDDVARDPRLKPGV